MENGPFEDVLPIEDGIFHCYVSSPEGIYIYIADNVHGKMFGANPGFRKYVVFKLHRKSNGSNS